MPRDHRRTSHLGAFVHRTGRYAHGLQPIQVVDPLIIASFSHSTKPDSCIKARIIIFSLILVLHFSFIRVIVGQMRLFGVEHL